MKMITVICFLVLASNSFAAHSSNDSELVISAKGTAFACQGFAHPSCFRTDEGNLQDAKRYTDSRAEGQCQDEGYTSAILLDEHQCEVDKVPSYSITTTCYATYLCE